MSLSQLWNSVKVLHFSQPASDRPLYRAVRGRTIHSVLEVNVGSGARSERLIDWLRAQGQTGPIRYAAIDDFELGGEGHIGLKAYHQRLSQRGAKPFPVPGDVAAAMRRVAQTVGAVDLLVFDLEAAQWHSAAIAAIAPRLVHPQTLVLIADGTPSSLRVTQIEAAGTAAPRRQAA